MIRDLVLKNRSYRRFDQTEQIPRSTLLELVELARFSPSAANLQPLKYILVNDPEENRKVFATLSWAGYLKEWRGPEEGEQPSAYIIILGDTTIANGFDCDHGIAAQSILLGAVDRGLGGCMLGAIDREALKASLSIPEQYRILLVLAIGRPVEAVVLEDVREDGSIRYWRDERSVHHVPKRSIKELVIR